MQDQQKVFYSHINSQKKCEVVIRAIKNTDGSLTTDLSEIADVLSEQFASAFSETSASDDQLPPFEARTNIILEDIDRYMPNSLAFLFRKINRWKPAGFDGVHPYVLTECADSLSVPFSIIFNISVKDKYPLNGQKAILPQFTKKAQKQSQRTTGLSLSLLSHVRFLSEF